MTLAAEVPIPNNILIKIKLSIEPEKVPMIHDIIVIIVDIIYIFLIPLYSAKFPQNKGPKPEVMRNKDNIKSI